MPFRKAKPGSSGGLLPGYEGLEEIGGGAFATVYRAMEAETGRPVALKILKVDTIHAHLIETFHQEIQALAQVSDHPNIVTLYRPSTTTDGRPVLVLELCRGSLASKVRTSGPLEAQEVVRVGVKIAGALETAHRNGFLHRDMKPQNILVTNFGEPALADFGVAALQASAQITAGVFGFTTLHAAPEMLEGHHLSPATDIYGLASTMYQLLTGQAPFATFDNEAPASVILRILRDPVRPLRSEHIPLDLSDLLEGALSKQPEGRPRTALDFAYALQAVEEEQGWPVTDFVAWGQEHAPLGGRLDPAARSGAGTASSPWSSPAAIDLRSSGAGSGPAAARGPLYPTAPAVRVEGVESPAGRPALPPLLPPAASPGPADPYPAGAHPAVPPAPAPSLPPAPASGSPPAPAPSLPPAPASGSPPGPRVPPAPSAGTADPPVPALSPEPPPPPAPRRGPSLAAPEPASRHVVAPAPAGRGQSARPLHPPDRPLQPLGPDPVGAASGGPGRDALPGERWSRPAFPDPPAGDRPPGAAPASAGDRPVFVDPPAPGTEPGSMPSDSVYERTMEARRLFGDRPAAEAPPSPSRPTLPALAVVGLAVAAAVLIAAVLLLAGVI